MTNAILSFDLGQHTGYAWCADDALYTGVIDVSRHKGDNRLGAMFSAFTVEVTHIIKTVGPQAVHFEDATHAARRTSAAQSVCWFGFHACLRGVCHELGVPIHPVSTSTYKKRTGLPFRCGKNAVVKWCNDQMIPVRDENEADAVAILNAVLDEYGCKLSDFQWRKS